MAARHVLPLRKDSRWIAAIALVVVVLFFFVGSSSTARDAVPGLHKVTASSKPVDHFARFNRAPGCDYGSQDIYMQNKEVCPDRRTMLAAVSDGGRVGYDAPYQSRGCDMRWYSTDEICDILSRFDNIFMLGDSMVRHLAQSVNVFIREDLVSGARATWTPGNPAELDCHCHTLWDNHTCAAEGFAIVGTEELMLKDPDSVRCKGNLPRVVFMSSVLDPPQPAEIDFFKESVRSGMKPGKSRSAYVFGQGGWNDFTFDHTQHWMRIYEGALNDPNNFPSEYKDADLPERLPPKLKTRAYPRLYMGPNAQGLNKPIIWVGNQNNIKLMNFERQMRDWLVPRGWDMIGIFNLTIQSESTDGTHATMESNLVKTMMFFNWLDSLEREGPAV